MLALVHLASYYPYYEPDETLEEIAVHHNQHAPPGIADYDPEYEDHVGDSWRRVLAPGLEYIKLKY